MNKPVLIREFIILFNYSVIQHSKTGEPIPEMSKDNISKVDNCLKTPFSTFDGADLYPDIYDKAAILFYVFIKNHPLTNGNKRMAYLTMAYFLNKNKIKLKLSNDTVYDFTKNVAMSDSKDKDYVIEYIKQTIQPKKMNKGGKLVGASHAQGGIDIITPNGKIEAEGGEVIINKAASKKHCEVLSEINQSAGNGVAIPCDGAKESQVAENGTKVNEGKLDEKPDVINSKYKIGDRLFIINPYEKEDYYEAIEEGYDPDTTLVTGEYDIIGINWRGGFRSKFDYELIGPSGHKHSISDIFIEKTEYMENENHSVYKLTGGQKQKTMENTKNDLINHLSGEHKDAMIMAKKLLNEGTVEENADIIVKEWRGSLLPHFKEEESQIYNVRQDVDSKHFIAEHKIIQQLVEKIAAEPNQEDIAEFAETLIRHISEEEEYFYKTDKPMKAASGTKISSATTSELDKAVSDLHRVEKAQKMMKEANAIIRSKKNVQERLVKEAGFSEAEAEKIVKGDFRGRVGFSSYALTNNNANLKRLQDRVKMLQKKVEGAKAVVTGGAEKYSFENGFFEVNYEADRVQIFFEGMPTTQQKNDLKRNGWHWSYTNKAWQRKITPQAIRNAEYLFKATKIVKTEAKPEETVAETPKFTKVAEISNDIKAFCEAQGLPQPERELANKGNTVYLSWPEEKIEAIIDAGSPVADGIFLKKKSFMVENYKLSALREAMLKLKELFKKEETNETVLEPNTPEDFDEVIISNIDPHDGWLGNEIKERAIKKQIYDQLMGPVKERMSNAARIFKKYYDRTLLKEERVDLMSPEQKLAFKQMNQTSELAQNVAKPTDINHSVLLKNLDINPQPGWKGNIVKEGNIRRQILEQLSGTEEEKLILAQRLFHEWTLTQIGGVSSSERINTDYKNQYELNKSIEAFITEKGGSPSDYTSDEKNWIRKYSGYGGLDKYGTTGKGGLFEYYTPKDVIEKMWALAYKYGYNNGPVLEPSVATGEFLQFTKPESRVVGYEISQYSAQICKILYPNAEILRMPFEEHFIKNNWTMKDNLGSLEKFDLVIGNPPYGDFSIVASRYMTGMGEKDHTKAKNYVEYFIRRGLDLLNPKGLLIFIVGAQVKNGGTLFLDSGPSPVKEYLQQNCELIDAYRLPDSIFERTGVTSEIIVLQKN